MARTSLKESIMVETSISSVRLGKLLSKLFFIMPFINPGRLKPSTTDWAVAFAAAFKRKT